MKFDSISFMSILLVLVIIGFVGFLGFAAISGITEYEVESFTFGAKITHLDKDVIYRQHSGTSTVYSVSVCEGDWFAWTFKINSSQYARYKVGDILTIKSITSSNIFNHIRTDYEIVE